MSIIEAVSDVQNTFLSRRELTCNFAGMAGKLDKLGAIEMISKEFKLDGKLVIPMMLKNHVGKSLVTGTFFVYGDEALARSHVNPTAFKRLERARKAKEGEQAAAEDAKPAEDAAKPAGDAAKPDAKPEGAAKPDAKPEGAAKPDTKPAEDAGAPDTGGKSG